MTFLSDAERVWIRMKECVVDFADRGQVPTTRTALGIIARIVREEHAMSMPEEACRYFAEELQRMVRESASSCVK